MHSRTLTVCCLTGLFLWPLSALPAQPPSLVVEVVTTFDYPGVGNSTTPYHINSFGDCAGIYIDSSGVTRGFVRLAHGGFMAPIVDPNDDSNFTFAGGIDNSRTVCGYYFNSVEGRYRGYFFANGAYSDYDAPFADNTFLNDIYDVHHYCGYFLIGEQQMPFAQIGGLFYQFSFSPALDIRGNGMNNHKRIVGVYEDFFAPPIFHGFYANANQRAVGRPFDFPGSTSTSFNAINNQEIVVGYYLDVSGGEHGLIFRLPDKYVSYDFPGAMGTSLNGVNDSGLVSGRYSDFDGINHGFIGQIHYAPN